ncbi:HAD-IIIA family hydrolase [Comamonas sp. lk]|uniref:D-glycero-alpha-D-manno-heptose-1,7-bisphosphate 7-phosphatase n=1 Tax=Comamonas sp. lk TaxID=2201272 RepID=UPI000EB06078|nr:HAD-IIIA family hydrolase [Comamonas sp. lk]
MKLAILDRDGTLNQWVDQGFIGQPQDWVAVPGALEAVSRLNRAGWHVVLATNQPGLGRGLFDVIELNAVHAKMHRELALAGARVEAVFYCPHAPEEVCSCRKPGAALFEQIAERYGAEGAEVWAIGSGLEHLQAGQSLGAHLMFVESSGRPEGQEVQNLPAGSQRFADLEAAVSALLSLGDVEVAGEDARP